VGEGEEKEKKRRGGRRERALLRPCSMLRGFKSKEKRKKGGNK